MIKQYLKTVFPAQAGNQCCYEVQSITNAQPDTRLREYDEVAYDDSTSREAV